MVRSTQPPWIITGLGMLPPTVLIVLHHAWLGAATLCAVLFCAVLQIRLEVRAAQQRHQATLTYAQDATNMGGDPTTVIAALHGGQPQHGAPPELPARQYDLRGYQQVRSMADNWPYRPPRV
ncbi:MAG TPA: hypothetical protein VGI84_06255 [Pseudonocardiaceae bacterium]|jgi:hypothetical protein